MVPLDDCREPVFNTPEHQNLYAEVMALPAKYGGGGAAGPEALHRSDPACPGQRETESTAEGGVSHAEHLSGDI